MLLEVDLVLVTPGVPGVPTLTVPEAQALHVGKICDEPISQMTSMGLKGQVTPLEDHTASQYMAGQGNECRSS